MPSDKLIDNHVIMLIKRFGDNLLSNEKKMKNKRKSKKFLLILPCSKQKKELYGVHALELYDGPFYRVVRKNKPKNLDILILSAKYGLINSEESISYYDQIMTNERAEELSNKVVRGLNEKLKDKYYNSIFINLGKTYMLALKDSKSMLDEYNVYQARGQIGERLHQLKNWLTTIRAKDGVVL